MSHDNRARPHVWWPLLLLFVVVPLPLTCIRCSLMVSILFLALLSAVSSDACRSAAIFAFSSSVSWAICSTSVHPYDNLKQWAVFSNTHDVIKYLDANHITNVISSTLSPLVNINLHHSSTVCYTASSRTASSIFIYCTGQAVLYSLGGEYCKSIKSKSVNSQAWKFSKSEVSPQK